MGELDTGLRTQLRDILSKALDPDPYVQQTIYAQISQFLQIKESPLYLLEELADNEASYSSRYTSANLLRHHFQNLPFEYRKQFKNRVASALLPIMRLPSSPLVSSTAAFIASLVIEFGSSVFPSLTETIQTLLSDESTLRSGLETLLELSFSSQISSELFHSLTQFLDSDFADTVLKIATNCVSQHPEFTLNNFFLPLYNEKERLPDHILSELVDLTSSLSQIEMTEEMVDFMHYCLNSPYESVCIPAAGFFYQYPCPFSIGIFETLVSKLASDEDVDGEGMAAQCYEALKFISDAYPDESLQALSEMLAKGGNPRTILRLISSLSGLITDAEEMFKTVSEYLDTEYKTDAVFCLTKLNEHLQDADRIIEVIGGYVNDPNGVVRMQVLRCLCELFKSNITYSHVMPILMKRLYESAEDELYLVLETLACLIENSDAFNITLFFVCENFILTCDTLSILLVPSIRIVAALVPKLNQPNTDSSFSEQLKAKYSLSSDTSLDNVIEKLYRILMITIGFIEADNDNELSLWSINLLSSVLDSSLSEQLKELVISESLRLLPLCLSSELDGPRMSAWALASQLYTIGANSVVPICKECLNNIGAFNVDVYCNVCFMFYLICKDCHTEVSREVALKLLAVIKSLLDKTSLDDVLTLQNVGACLSMLCGLFPDIVRQEEVVVRSIESLIPYVQLITPEERAEECVYLLSHML